MLHVSTSAADVIMKSQHSQAARSVHFTDGTVTHGWGGGSLTLQTSMKNGSRNRHVIPVNYEKQVAYFVHDKSKL